MYVYTYLDILLMCVLSMYHIRCCKIGVLCDCNCVSAFKCLSLYIYYNIYTSSTWSIKVCLPTILVVLLHAGGDRCDGERDSEWGILWTVTAVNGVDVQNCVEGDFNAGQ